MTIEIIDLISENTYGTVYSVKFLDKLYACKFMNIENYHIPFDFMSEINSVNRTNHPNIIKFDGFFFMNNNQCSIVMELGICDLDDLIHHNDKEYDVKSISYQILSALNHLNNRGIVTGDLKSENIIVFENGRVALSDFGLSQINVFAKSSQWKFTNAYTITYRAPEILKNRKYDEKAEAWAFGIILYELENKEKIFIVEDSDGCADDDKDVQLDCIYQKKTELEFYSKNPCLDDLIKKLLNDDPKKRISIHDALNHPYYKDLKSENIVKIKKRSILLQNQLKVTQGNIGRNKKWNKILQKSIKLKKLNFNNNTIHNFIINNSLTPRIINLSIQIMDRLTNLQDKFKKKEFLPLFYVTMYIAVQFCDVNYVTRGVDLIRDGHKLTSPAKFLDLQERAIECLNGNIYYTSPNDFIDYYSKKYDKEIIKFAHHISLCLYITNLPFDYDSEQLAFFSLKLASGKNYVHDKFLDDDDFDEMNESLPKNFQKLIEKIPKVQEDIEY